MRTTASSTNASVAMDAQPAAHLRRPWRRRKLLARALAALAVTAAMGAFADAAYAKLKNRPPVLIPSPSNPYVGCHLTGVLYDTVKNQTTFSYDCNHAVDSAGHRGYTEMKPGNYFANQ